MNDFKTISKPGATLKVSTKPVNPAAQNQIDKVFQDEKQTICMPPSKFLMWFLTAIIIGYLVMAAVCF